MYKVIIIEDDPMVASINKQYVELTSSFHVEATFKNGILALQYLQNCTVDLVILDYYTPQMNGDEFIDQLHAAGMTPAIIMVTSANDAETVRRLISRGCSVNKELSCFNFGSHICQLELICETSGGIENIGVRF